MPGLILTPVNGYQKGYQLLWGAGCDLNNIDKCVKGSVTSIAENDNTFTIMWEWNPPGDLIGTFEGNVLRGKVSQGGIEGDFELFFEEDFSKATGWWKRNDRTKKDPLFIRSMP